MKQLCAALTVSLVLALPVWAEPLTRAIVLQAHQAFLNQDQQPLQAGQSLPEGATFRIEAGGSATLLHLAKGQRLRVQGPANVKVDKSQLKGAPVSVLIAPKVKLNPSGQNFRRLAGLVVRKAITPEIAAASRRLKRFTVSGQTLTLELEPDPQRIDVLLFEQAALPRLNGLTLSFVRDSVETPVQFYHLRGPGPHAIALSRVVPGRSYGIQIQQGTLLVERRLQLLTAQQLEALQSSRRALEAWIGGHPEDLSSYVQLIALLDDSGDSDAALAWCERALAQAPQDADLRALRARLLVDAGRYAPALEQLNLPSKRSD